MYKTATIIGTRPELIKMSLVISELDKFTNHILIHTGQNYDYELNQIFFEDLGIREPDYFMGIQGDTSAKRIANIIESADKILREEMPDALLVYGDTDSCLAVIAAKRLKIPIFHMEAGNRCFDQRVPEEINRKIVDHLSDINMVISDHSRRYLLAEGIRADTIIKTGSHMREVLDRYKENIEASSVLDRMELDSGRFFLVSAHREENVDDPNRLYDLVSTLNAIADEYGYPIIVSVHPRTSRRLEEQDIIRNNPLSSLVRLTKPLGYFDFMKLQMSALCVLSDSGTISEEASLLAIPAINIRDCHERPESFDSIAPIMAGVKKVSVLEAIRVASSQHSEVCKYTNVADYNHAAVSSHVIRILISYIGYVNSYIWRKSS